MTVVAVVSDTHLPRGARRLPDECLARLSRAAVVLHAGDLVTVAVLEELSALGPPVHAVHGNVDEPALQERLPARRVVEVDGVRIGLQHDGGARAGRRDRLVAAFPGCAAVVYGHSHQPEVTRHGSVWVLNPGSPTERRRAPSRSMLELRVRGTDVVPTVVELA